MSSCAADVSRGEHHLSKRSRVECAAVAAAAEHDYCQPAQRELAAKGATSGAACERPDERMDDCMAAMVLMFLSCRAPEETKNKREVLQISQPSPKSSQLDSSSAAVGAEMGADALMLVASPPEVDQSPKPAAGSGPNVGRAQSTKRATKPIDMSQTNNNKRPQRRHRRRRYSKQRRLADSDAAAEQNALDEEEEEEEAGASDYAMQLVRRPPRTLSLMGSSSDKASSISSSSAASSPCSSQVSSAARAAVSNANKAAKPLDISAPQTKPLRGRRANSDSGAETDSAQLDLDEASLTEPLPVASTGSGFIARSMCTSSSDCDEELPSAPSCRRRRRKHSAANDKLQTTNDDDEMMFELQQVHAVQDASEHLAITSGLHRRGSIAPLSTPSSSSSSSSHKRKIIGMTTSSELESVAKPDLTCDSTQQRLQLDNTSTAIQQHLQSDPIVVIGASKCDPNNSINCQQYFETQYLTARAEAIAARHSSHLMNNRKKQTRTVFSCMWPNCTRNCAQLEHIEHHVRSHLGCDSIGDEDFYYEETEVDPETFGAIFANQQHAELHQLGQQQQHQQQSGCKQTGSGNNSARSPNHCNSDGLSSGTSFASSSSPATSPVCSSSTCDSLSTCSSSFDTNSMAYLVLNAGGLPAALASKGVFAVDQYTSNHNQRQTPSSAARSKPNSSRMRTGKLVSTGTTTAQKVACLNAVQPHYAARKTAPSCVSPVGKQSNPNSTKSDTLQASTLLRAAWAQTSKDSKCRKVYGMDNREQWCNQCKWKKACSRFCDV